MNNFIEEDNNYILNTYRRNKLLIVKAKGKYVWDNNGKKYLDFFAGLSVVNIGHSHPAIVKAIKRQSARLIHTSNLYYTMPQINLAKALSGRSLGGKVFFCNSGAESIETAIKIARKYGEGKKYEVISFSNSFHGRTLGALSATGQEKFRLDFQPLLPGFKYAEFNDPESVKNIITDKTAAIIVEPVQGEGGVYPAKKEFLQSLRKIADENKITLIFDEVQCGLGRTGRLFAYQYYGVKPDVICLAKGLGGGLPLGACVVSPHLNSVFNYGDHGTTFGGNPVSCSAGLEVLKIIDDALLGRVTDLGQYFKIALNELAKEFNIIREVRGVGLMLGIELGKPCNDVVGLAQEKGLLINCTHDFVLRFLPPFVVEKSDIGLAVEILRGILKKY